MIVTDTSMEPLLSIGMSMATDNVAVPSSLAIIRTDGGTRRAFASGFGSTLSCVFGRILVEKE